jgi:N-acetylgalactosamine-6-sulfatase
VCTALVLAGQLLYRQSVAAEPLPRPNIVLIVADDLGYGDLGCYGAPDIRTPVLDRLAREGIRFSSFYSNGPECTPTRTALMTGRYQHRVGGLECAIGVHNVGRYDDAIRLADQHDLGLPVDEQTLPQLLNRAGYVCGLFGKWHLGYEEKFRPLQHGFATSFGILGGNADYFRHTEADGWNVLFENDRLIAREGYITDLITDAALEWYERVKNRPFFLYVPYTAPHAPLQGPDDDTGEALPAEAWNSGLRTTFAAMVERMDADIGRILQAIDDDGLRANTLVIFMSDNGGDANGRNSPFSGRKGTTYEGGIRVPCIARWPRHLPEGQVVAHVALTMDVTASIVRIAGAEFPADRPAGGIDILAEIEQDRPVQPRQLFWRGRRGEVTWRAAREGNFKRIWKQDGDEIESWLFDLGNDPAERTNLLTEHAEDAARLQALMSDWEREVAPRR